MGLNNRGTVKECNQLPFLVTFLNLALIYCHIPFKQVFHFNSVHINKVPLKLYIHSMCRR